MTQLLMREFRWSLLAVLGLAVALSACSQSQTSLDEEVTQLLANTVQVDEHYPFMTAYVESSSGEVLVSSAVANTAFFDQASEPTVDDWMRIWSMSKLVTIVLTLDLAEDGVIALNDEVSDYLPEVATLKVARPRSGGTLASNGRAEPPGHPRPAGHPV